MERNVADACIDRGASNLFLWFFKWAGLTRMMFQPIYLKPMSTKILEIGPIGESSLHWETTSGSNCNKVNKMFMGGLQGREILMAGTRYLIWHFNMHGIVTRSVKFVYRIAQDRVHWIEAAGSNRGKNSKRRIPNPVIRIELLAYGSLDSLIFQWGHNDLFNIHIIHTICVHRIFESVGSN